MMKRRSRFCFWEKLRIPRIEKTALKRTGRTSSRSLYLVFCYNETENTGERRKQMKVVIIDGQGGRLGQMVAEAIIRKRPETDLLVIGTNSIATAAMLKSGAGKGATGENPVIVACRDADVIIGPIGIVSADSLLGEITPAMATAIGQSRAVKLLLPVSHCTNLVIGVKPLSMKEMAEETVAALQKLTEKSDGH